MTRPQLPLEVAPFQLSGSHFPRGGSHVAHRGRQDPAATVALRPTGHMLLAGRAGALLLPTALLRALQEPLPDLALQGQSPNLTGAGAAGAPGPWGSFSSRPVVTPFSPSPLPTHPPRASAPLALAGGLGTGL